MSSGRPAESAGLSTDANLKKLLAELQQRGQVTIAEGKVSYRV